MSKRKNLVAEVMSERIIYGGAFTATRSEVYSDWLARTGCAKSADRAAFSQRARVATAAEIACRGTFADLQAIEARIVRAA